MSKPNSIKGVLDTAFQDGNISKQSHQILVENLDPQTILGAQGVSPDDLEEDRITLFVPIVDHTGSRADEAYLMRSEYNNMIEAIKESKLSHTILVSSWLFDTTSKLLHGFVSLDDAERLDTGNYDPYGMTALYDAVLDALTSVTAYAKTMLDQGYRVKIVLVVLTDGEDNSSVVSPTKVKQVVQDLLNQEIYVMSMIAFGSGYANRAADEMGFPKENVIEYGQTQKDVRSAFQLVSNSVIRQSQTQVGGSTSFFN